MTSGEPTSRASARTASSSPSRGPFDPARTGTPAAIAASRARVLWPMRSMTSGAGPTHVSPASWTRRANAAFSERKP